MNIPQDVHIITYMSMLDLKYGKDKYLDFEPETFKADLNVSGKVLDRIMVGVLLKSSSHFWNDITSFEKCALALNNRTISFGEFQDISPAEIAWAMVESGLITQPEPLSEDVGIYIAKVLHDEGYLNAPFPLGETQSQLNDCNKISLDLLSEYGVLVDRDAVQDMKYQAVDDYLAKNMTEIFKEGEMYG